MIGGLSELCSKVYVRWAEGSMRGVGGLFDIVEMLSQLVGRDFCDEYERSDMSSKNKLRCGERNIWG